LANVGLYVDRGADNFSLSLHLPSHNLYPASVSSSKLGIMPSEELLGLCTHAQTVASALERDPTAGAGAVASQLFPRIKSGRAPAPLKRAPEDYTIADLDRAAECGKFGRRPSDLFLQVCTSIRGWH
jgi:hypothetical protein